MSHGVDEPPARGEDRHQTPGGTDRGVFDFSAYDVTTEETDMIIVLKPGSSDADIDDVSRRVQGMGFKTRLSRGEVRTIVGVVGDDRAKEQLLALQSLDCVESVVRILQPFKLASREAHPESTQFKVNGVPIGGKQLVVMAGPPSVQTPVPPPARPPSVKARGAPGPPRGALQPPPPPPRFPQPESTPPQTRPTLIS